MTGHVFPRLTPDLGNEPPEWTLAAVCPSVDPEIFFPEKGGTTRDAKAVCTRCVVRGECLSLAMTAEDGDDGDGYGRFGIYGGLSAVERKKLARTDWRPGDPPPPMTATFTERCPLCRNLYRNVSAHLRTKHHVTAAGAA